METTLEFQDWVVAPTPTPVADADIAKAKDGMIELADPLVASAYRHVRIECGGHDLWRPDRRWGRPGFLGRSIKIERCVVDDRLPLHAPHDLVVAAHPRKARYLKTAREWKASYARPDTRTQSPADVAWQAIEEEIEAARFILKIEADPDTEDFIPYTEETFGRATEFLKRLVIPALAAGMTDIGSPRIGPADNGSIDLFWEKPDRTLLINFSSREPDATFYGKKEKSEISGRFDPSEARPELAVWLTD
jgi:hypothetical protein